MPVPPVGSACFSGAESQGYVYGLRGQVRRNGDLHPAQAPSELTLQELIMVQVHSSWFPLADLNPQTFVEIPKAKASDFKKATQRVYHDKADPSAVVLGVLRARVGGK